jgi:hypothetical protein
VVKMIFITVSAITALSAVIVKKAISSCAVYMDDSFRWGGRDGNG